jgi:diazepam-binding inhibitor (GABA receptor modulator, acyl-CoA-binding protein)
MSDLNLLFQDAVAGSKNLTNRPDNTTMLKLYSLYKQATEGDAPEDAPGDLMGVFKHKAWAEIRGMASDDAKQRSIDLVNSLD